MARNSRLAWSSFPPLSVNPLDHMIDVYNLGHFDFAASEQKQFLHKLAVLKKTIRGGKQHWIVVAEPFGEEGFWRFQIRKLQRNRRRHFSRVVFLTKLQQKQHPIIRFFDMSAPKTQHVVVGFFCIPTSTFFVVEPVLILQDSCRHIHWHMRIRLCRHGLPLFMKARLGRWSLCWCRWVKGVRWARHGDWLWNVVVRVIRAGNCGCI